jgi:Malectin domain
MAGRSPSSIVLEENPRRPAFEEDFVKKFFGLIAGCVLACLPAAAQTQQPIRVKCGGPSYTDTNGQIWQADYGYNTGIASTNGNTTTGTSDPMLYRSNRYNPNATPMIYKFTVPNGAYRVNLLFAENYIRTVGGRIFNVQMNGTLVLRNFDIFATVGPDTAVVESFNATVTSGQIAIQFDKLVENPKINAIEILPLATSPLLTLKFVYPDGTPVSGTLNYAMSTSLLSLGGHLPLVNGQATCMMVTSPTVLGLVGQTQVALNLTDSSGNMLWQISMGVNPADANFSAVQNSTLNVVLNKP